MRNRRGERIPARDQRDANSPALKSFNGGAEHSLENPSDTHHLSEGKVWEVGPMYRAKRPRIAQYVRRSYMRAIQDRLRQRRQEPKAAL